VVRTGDLRITKNTGRIFGGRRSTGKPRGRGEECCLEGCHRCAADTIVERGSKEWRRLEVRDREGHDLKIDAFREIR